MCSKEVKEDPRNLIVVADWSVTQELVKICHDDEDCLAILDNGRAELFNGYNDDEDDELFLWYG